LKRKVAGRIRRIARVEEIHDRLGNIEHALHLVNHRAIDRDTVAEFVFLSELRSKAYTDDAISQVGSVRKVESNRFLSPEIYASFQERFRGPEGLIRDRLAVYISPVADAAGGRVVVDIGCGRGEWLEIAHEAGFSIRGVEVSPAAVDFCRGKGLDVVHLDAHSYLNAVEPGSLGAVTFFQVIEHFTLDELFEILRSSRIALGPGGLLLAEIPNITTLSVGASNFWIDPTHVRPLHPELVQFMAIQAGFQRAEIHFPSRMGKPDNPSVSGQDWQDRVDGCPDVAVMAWA
jgi:O-antigen chain-terminating methyltransferase